VTPREAFARSGRDGDDAHHTLLGQRADRVQDIGPAPLLACRDGILSEVDPQEGAAFVFDTVRDLRPQALITWPPDGLSGHPDHIAVSRWTLLGYKTAQATEWAAALTLYRLVVPETVANVVGLSGLHTVRDEDVTLAVDVHPVWREKLRAIQCHRTQAGRAPSWMARQAEEG